MQSEAWVDAGKSGNVRDFTGFIDLSGSESYPNFINPSARRNGMDPMARQNLRGKSENECRKLNLRTVKLNLRTVKLNLRTVKLNLETIQPRPIGWDHPSQGIRDPRQRSASPVRGQSPHNRVPDVVVHLVHNLSLPRWAQNRTVRIRRDGEMLLF